MIARPERGASPSRGPRSGRRRDRGQAVVELALSLPIVVLLLLAVVQVGLVVRDEILVVHAAREAARAAAVDPDSAAARRAAVASSGLDKGRIEVSTSGRGAAGSTLSVTVRYSAPTEVPLIGQLLPDVRLRAVASMRVEV